MLSIKTIYKIIFITSVLVLFSHSTNAQEVRVIDNKGTLKVINNNSVTTSNSAPTNPIENDVWFDTTNNEIKIYDKVDGWKLITSTIPQNIYNVDGTLISNRTLDGANGGSNYGLTFQNLDYLNLFSNNNTVITAGQAIELTAPNNIILQSSTEFNGTLIDINGDVGTTGQILSSTSTGVDWIDNPALNNWLITGNSGTTNSNFLGTIDDVRMQIRSNNIPILEFGRRQTLGLHEPTRTDYDDPDQSLVYLNGSNGISALQFKADGATFYKPMFYTTPNGSFRLKGSSGGTDFFEIGSAGPNNDGRLEFIIADDGNEPIVFKRFDYRSGEFYKEFFRVQGSDATENAKTRFGININQNRYSVADNINAPSNGGATNPKLTANSTLQVEGSISKSIEEVSTNTTLNEDQHTIVVTTNATINFPPANTCKGRIYVIKNISGGSINSSTYRNESNIDTSVISNNTTLQVQSDGTRWIGINDAPNSVNNNWSLTGNSSTNPTNNFIGTTDAQDVSIRTNNIEAIRIDQSNQNVGIGSNSPSEKLDVNGKLRVQDIQTVTTNTEILTTDANGVVQKKALIAAETDNLITNGANGGVYYKSPIRAMGKVNADGTTNKAPLNSNVRRLSTGLYEVTFAPQANINNTNYVIQLTVRDSAGIGNDDYDISYSNQTQNSFYVQVGDNDNGTADRTSRDFEFMYTVLDY